MQKASFLSQQVRYWGTSKPRSSTGMSYRLIRRSPPPHQPETYTPTPRLSYVVDLGIVRAFLTADDRVLLPAPRSPDNLAWPKFTPPTRPLHDFEPLVFKSEPLRSSRRVAHNTRQESVGSDAPLTFSETTQSPAAFNLS